MTILLKKKSAEICLILMIFSGIGPSQERRGVQPERPCPGINKLELVLAYEDSQNIDSASFELVKSFMYELTSRMLSGVSDYSTVSVAVMSFGDTADTIQVQSRFDQDPLVNINLLTLNENRPTTSVFLSLMNYYSDEVILTAGSSRYSTRNDAAILVVTTTPPGEGTEMSILLREIEVLKYLYNRWIMILGIGSDVASTYLQIEEIISVPKELNKTYFLVPTLEDLDANVDTVLNAMCISDPPPTTTVDPTTTEIETTEITTETTELTTETTELTTETTELTAETTELTAETTELTAESTELPAETTELSASLTTEVEIEPTTIQGIYCDPPVDIDNADVTFDGLKNAVGSFAVYKCYSGYSSKVKLSRMCGIAGTWSGKLPKCEASCEKPPEISNGNATYDSILGGLAYYKCNYGYTTHDSTTLICAGKQQWYGRVPKCQAVDSLGEAEKSLDPTMPEVNGSLMNNGFQLRGGQNIQQPPSENKETAEEEENDVSVSILVMQSLMVTGAIGGLGYVGVTKVMSLRSPTDLLKKPTKADTKQLAESVVENLQPDDLFAAGGKRDEEEPENQQSVSTMASV